MNARRLSLIVTNLIFVFILAACNLASSGTLSGTKTPIIMDFPTMSGSEPTATPPAEVPTLTSAPAGGACTNEYYPVSSAAAWTYASSGSVAGDYTYSRSMAGVSDTEFTSIDEFNAGVTRTVTWSCKAGNLTELQSISGNSGVTSTSGMKVTVDSANADGFVIPASFTVGQTWTETLQLNTTNYGSDGKKKGTGQSVTQTSCTGGDTESVTVPAGKFDAVKVDCSNSSTIVATVNGVANPPQTFIMNTTQWFAKGVGMVKMLSTGDSGDETVVLTAYTIP